ncbi:hypothetical protein EVAR_96378_1 [Eumeta japonica]|uniref:Uncharacterized protein n=1 Tax=Eumeta variegata TaxID=151549 RepID=A0A4C1WBA4_EUMVA|nr:hypothetical protein EVAR_96378_1 [Eumeta japonica]
MRSYPATKRPGVVAASAWSQAASGAAVTAQNKYIQKLHSGVYSILIIYAKRPNARTGVATDMSRVVWEALVGPTAHERHRLARFKWSKPSGVTYFVVSASGTRSLAPRGASALSLQIFHRPMVGVQRTMRRHNKEDAAECGRRTAPVARSGGFEHIRPR